MTAQEFAELLAELVANANEGGLSFEAITAELREATDALEEALS